MNYKIFKYKLAKIDCKFTYLKNLFFYFLWDFSFGKKGILNKKERVFCKLNFFWKKGYFLSWKREDLNIENTLIYWSCDIFFSILKTKSMTANFIIKQNVYLLISKECVQFRYVREGEVKVTHRQYLIFF